MLKGLEDSIAVQGLITFSHRALALSPLWILQCYFRLFTQSVSGNANAAVNGFFTHSSISVATNTSV